MAGPRPQGRAPTPGETLFPVSLLTRAKIVGAGGAELGTCVDAMAGCRGGMPRYVVVAEGGVAGVGETLRRVEWRDAHGRRRSARHHARRRRIRAAPTNWPGTNGRAADRHGAAGGPPTWPGSTACARAHFPPERNQLGAHLTMFHAIPPSLETEVRQRLAAFGAELPPPRASVAGLMNLGGEWPIRIVSRRSRCDPRRACRRLSRHLTRRTAGWRPHVTIQNKVAAAQSARAARPACGVVRAAAAEDAGLAFDRYLGGPWAPGRRYPFRGAER